MEDQRELLRLQEEEEYWRRALIQHKHNLQDSWDSMVQLRSHIAMVQQTVNEVATEESLEQALTTNMATFASPITESTALSTSSTVTQTPLRRSSESFPAFRALTLQDTNKAIPDRLLDWKLEGTVTLFDVLSGRNKLLREDGERASVFKTRLLKRLAHMQYLEAQLQQELEDKARFVQLTQEQVLDLERRRAALQASFTELAYNQHHTGGKEARLGASNESSPMLSKVQSVRALSAKKEATPESPPSSGRRGLFGVSESRLTDPSDSSLSPVSPGRTTIAQLRSELFGSVKHVEASSEEFAYENASQPGHNSSLSHLIDVNTNATTVSSSDRPREVVFSSSRSGFVSGRVDEDSTRGSERDHLFRRLSADLPIFTYAASPQRESPRTQPINEVRSSAALGVASPMSQHRGNSLRDESQNDYVRMVSDLHDALLAPTESVNQPRNTSRPASTKGSVNPRAWPCNDGGNEVAGTHDHVNFERSGPTESGSGLSHASRFDVHNLSSSSLPLAAKQTTRMNRNMNTSVGTTADHESVHDLVSRLEDIASALEARNRSLFAQHDQMRSLQVRNANQSGFEDEIMLSHRSVYERPSSAQYSRLEDSSRELASSVDSIALLSLDAGLAQQQSQLRQLEARLQASEQRMQQLLASRAASESRPASGMSSRPHTARSGPSRTSTVTSATRVSAAHPAQNRKPFVVPSADSASRMRAAAGPFDPNSSGFLTVSSQRSREGRESIETLERKLQRANTRLQTALQSERVNKRTGVAVSECGESLGLLELTVVKAANLPEMKKLTRSADAFVEVFLCDTETSRQSFVARTAVQHRALFPVWQEFVSVAPVDKLTHTVRFHLRDSSRLGDSMDAVIGDAYLPFNTLRDQAKHLLWLPVHSPVAEAGVAGSRRSAQGTLKLPGNCAIQVEAQLLYSKIAMHQHQVDTLTRRISRWVEKRSDRDSVRTQSREPSPARWEYDE